MLKLSTRIWIPLNEIEVKAVRSQGSGGQNVNKVATAVHLFFDIKASSLPEVMKERLLSMSDQRITQEGVIVIKAQETRSQESNREAALERLKQLLKSAISTPKKRRPTKPSKRAKEKRMNVKSLRSRTKSLRNRPGSGD